MKGDTVTDDKYRNAANPEYHAAMHELRSSSAASPHEDRRTRRARTRNDAKRRAVEDFDS